MGNKLKLTSYLDGEFIEGKGNRPDRLKVDVYVPAAGNQMVFVQFNSPISDLLMLPGEALQLADSLRQAAKVAEGEEGEE